MKQETTNVAHIALKYDRADHRIHKIERIYRKLPVWAQNLAVSLYGVSYRRERLGGVFDRCTAEFRARDRWPVDRMKEFLQQELRTVLRRAFREVPYYNQKWKSAGLDSEDLERMTLSDLSKLRVTPKRDLVGNEHLFVAQDIVAKKKLHRYCSSGSTGTPVTCIYSAEDHQRFYAAREARSD